MTVRISMKPLFPYFPKLLNKIIGQIKCLFICWPHQFHHHQLRLIVQPRYGPGRVAESPADDQPAVVQAGGDLRQDSLTRGEQSLTKNPDLAAVGVAGQGQIDVQPPDVTLIVFRVVAQQDLIALDSSIGPQPVEVWHRFFR